MKEILRSVIKTQSTDKEEFLFKNYLKLLESGLEFDIPQDLKIFSFIKDFAGSNNHTPELRTVNDYFERQMDQETLDRINEIILLDPVFRGDFEKKIEDIFYYKRIFLTKDILSSAEKILQTGLEVQQGKKKKTYRGAFDAIKYVMDHSQNVIRPSFRSRLSGEVTTDGQSLKDEYERIKADPLSGMGFLTGIDQIDEVVRGAKRSELWIHAAFTGGLKSTFGLNWAYNQSVYYKNSSLYFSIEMPYDQVRRILWILHSYNAKFQQLRMDLGIQQSLYQPVGIPYRKLREGCLSQAEERFLFDYVIPDWSDENNGYGKIFIEVSDPDKDDFTMIDIKTKAEFIYAQNPFSLLFIDHLGLVSSRKGYQSTTESQNEVVRDAKKLSGSFNRGLGVPVIGFFQINRQGYEKALKNDGLYSLSALSYANECERSADIVTTTFLDDDMRRSGLVQFQTLKSRDTAFFEPFKAKIEFEYRRMKTLFEGVESIHKETKEKKSTDLSDLFQS